MKKETSRADERIYRERKLQVDSQRAEGKAYPNDFRPERHAAELPGLFEKQGPVQVSVAGRIMLRRDMGKAAFAVLEDASGRVQLYASHDTGQTLKILKAADLGDIVGAAGELFMTRKGELTVRLDELRVLAKCLRPLPDKHSGLVDSELRHRKRHLALLADPAEREKFALRSRLLRELRSFLDARGYLEVETPMMHPIPGGAAAEPFETRLNALGINLFLRVAPELYLKRLLVGGYERVYELNRSFRNEGMSAQHNPEFTMLEFYAAYRRHTDHMDLIEELLTGLAGKFGPLSEWCGHRPNFGKWRRVPLPETLLEKHGWSTAMLDDAEFLASQLAEMAGARVAQAVREGEVSMLRLLLFEKTVEESLADPTFVTDYPACASPLARRNPADTAVAERFELFVCGREIANGFSELNDPFVQDKVFREQAHKLSHGDAEAMRYDADYIAALECGMPPAAGAGIGVDRLAMLLLGCDSIRDVLLFPAVRPAG